MQCPFCGKEVLENQLFCAACKESFGIATAVADRPERLRGAPEQADVVPPRRGKKKKVLPFFLTGLCALSLLVLALLVGAYYDTVDPLKLQEILWPDENWIIAPTPPPDTLSVLGERSDGLTALVMPVSRGEPLGDDRDNVRLLLRAAVCLEEGVSADEPVDTALHTDFLWMALHGARPSGRFDETPGGYFVPMEDVNDLYRETLGYVPDRLPSQTASFAVADDGYEWRDDFVEGMTIDIFDWVPQSDASVCVRFNVLYAGILYDSFRGQGEALLTPNDMPCYYRFHLNGLNWDMPGRFKPSRITAGSSLQGQGTETYLPDNLTDGNPATAWVAGAGGAGAELTLDLGAEHEVTGLTMVNGLLRNVASMKQNSRVKEFRVSCGDFQRDFEMEDVSDYNADGDWQSFTFGQIVKTDKITVTILSLYAGSVSDKVCIGEIELF